MPTARGASSRTWATCGHRAEVPAGWAPYRNGHWAWIDPWGWTWVDDAPWGFAPFHYGRWTVVDDRWGWVPGPVRQRAVYAPALVAFIGGAEFLRFGVERSRDRLVPARRPARSIGPRLHGQPRLLHARECHQHHRQHDLRYQRLRHARPHARRSLRAISSGRRRSPRCRPRYSRAPNPSSARRWRSIGPRSTRPKSSRSRRSRRSAKA